MAPVEKSALSNSSSFKLFIDFIPKTQIMPIVKRGIKFAVVSWLWLFAMLCGQQAPSRLPGLVDNARIYLYGAPPKLTEPDRETEAMKGHTIRDEIIAEVFKRHAAGRSSARKYHKTTTLTKYAGSPGPGSPTIPSIKVKGVVYPRNPDGKEIVVAACAKSERLIWILDRCTIIGARPSAVRFQAAVQCGEIDPGRGQIFAIMDSLAERGKCLKGEKCPLVSLMKEISVCVQRTES